MSVMVGTSDPGNIGMIPLYTYTVGTDTYHVHPLYVVGTPLLHVVTW